KVDHAAQTPRRCRYGRCPNGMRAVRSRWGGGMALPARSAGGALPPLGGLQLPVGLFGSDGAPFPPRHPELPAAPPCAATLGRRLARVLGLLTRLGFEPAARFAPVEPRRHCLY